MKTNAIDQINYFAVIIFNLKDLWKSGSFKFISNVTSADLLQCVSDNP